MMPRRLLWTVPVALTLLALVPWSAATPASHVTAAVTPAKVPAPVWGTVTNCRSASLCAYAFNSAKGTGWANASGVTSSTEKLAVQLPGETKASYNLSYSTYLAKLTGTYTYWTVGTFVGTDVNSGKAIYGSTNTNYTLTCTGHSGRGGGCTYTYKTDNGTIVVKFTNAEITSTSLSCSPSSINAGSKTSCAATVTNGWNSSEVPNGTIRFYDGRTGSLSNKGSCALVNGACSFTYRPYDNTCGSVVIVASYLGTAAFYRSAGSFTVSVIVAGGC